MLSFQEKPRRATSSDESQRVVQVMESQKTGVGAAIADLPTCDFTVSADAPTECVRRPLTAAPTCPARSSSRATRSWKWYPATACFGTSAGRSFAKSFCANRFASSSPCGAATCCGWRPAARSTAAELALARPHQQAFEPILVDYGDRVGLLDAQVLLVAQAQLLSLSRLVEAESATRPRPPTAPRATSSPTSPTNCVHRCTASSVTPASG